MNNKLPVICNGGLLCAALTALVVASNAALAADTANNGAFSDANWESMGSNRVGPDGPATRIVTDNTGNFYLGGLFSRVDNVPANNIAKWDGVKWSALGSGLSGPVSAMALAGTDLFVSGSFTNAGGVQVMNIAKWDGKAWSSLGTGLDGRALALAVSGGVLYAGGTFSSAGGITSSNHLAKWDGNRWLSLDAGLEKAGFGVVRALAVSGTSLYAGGTPTKGSGSVARLDGETWSVLPNSVVVDANALVAWGTDLYAGGSGNVVRWTGTNWAAVGGFATLQGDIYALAAQDGKLAVGGTFSRMRTGTMASPAGYVAVWNGTAWDLANKGLPLYVWALAWSGGQLYAGGDFGFAGFNGRWANVGNGDLNLNGPAFAMANAGTNLVVGGGFVSAGGKTANKIAGWDGASWSSFGSGISSNGSVATIAVCGTNLYAGGDFTRVGNTSSGGLARWNGEGWSPVFTDILWSSPIVNALAASGTNLFIGGIFFEGVVQWDGLSRKSLNSGLDSGYGTANALAVAGQDLYVGGKFTTAGDVGAMFVAKWGQNRWSPLGSGVNGTVHALAVSGTNLYVGGIFTAAGGLTANGIARWDGAKWWPLGSGVMGTVYSLAVCGTNLYVGGNFTNAGAVAANYIAKWDGQQWSALGSGVDWIVQSLAVSGDYLYVGGAFRSAGKKSSPYLARARLFESAAPARVAHGPALKNGRFVVRYAGTPGSIYTLEYKDKLTSSTWLKQTNLTAPATGAYGPGVFEFIENPSVAASRFYRVVSPAY